MCLATAATWAKDGEIVKPAEKQDTAPQRIIALAPHTVELLFSLGVGDRIIATTDFATYPEAAQSIPRIGGYNGLQIEQAYALQPDLVLAWESGNRAEDLARLESLGLRVDRGDIPTIGDIPQRLRDLGRLLHVEEKAEALASQFAQELRTIQEQHAAKAPVSFFYQLWLEPLKTLTPGSWVNDIPRSCGGQNIFADQGPHFYPQVSIENVLLKQPEVIIVPSHHGDVIASGDMWKDWPEIPAVANKQIHFIDGDLLHRPTLRVLDGLKRVCTIFDQIRAESTNSSPTEKQESF